MTNAKVVEKNELTQQELKENLHYNPLTGIFTRLKSMTNTVKVGDIAGSKEKTGYVSITINNKHYRAHRLAWLYMTGEIPKGMIDHKDGVKDNNRFNNLREADKIQNGQNQNKARKGSSSGFLGVSYNKNEGKYSAQIGLNFKKKHLGYYNTAEEAYQVYLVAKRNLHPFSTL